MIFLKHIVTEVKSLLARRGHLHVECVDCLVRLCSLQLAKVLYTKAGPYAGPTFAVRRSLTRPGLPNLRAQRVARSCPVHVTLGW